MKKVSNNQFEFSKRIAVIALIATSVWINGCSQSSSVVSNTGASPTKADVRTFTGISGGTVSASNTSGKIPEITDIHSIADSITITRARVVISALKLHSEGVPDIDTIIVVGGGNGDIDWHKKSNKDKDEDEKDIITIIDRNDGTIRVGPFVAEFNDTSEKILSEVTIPPGTYDQIKFEIHKLDENDDPALLNDSLFGDFVNGGRYTFIVEGFSWVNGAAYPFEFKSSQTANVTIDITPPAVFDVNHQYDLRLVFDPKIIFGRPGMKPLDPRDPDNQEAIEHLIANAIRLLR